MTTQEQLDYYYKKIEKTNLELEQFETNHYRSPARRALVATIHETWDIISSLRAQLEKETAQ